MTRRFLVGLLLLATGCSAASPASTDSASSSPRPVTRATGAAAPQPVVRVATVMHLPLGVSRTVVVAAGNGLLVLGGLASGDTTTARVWRVDLATRRAQRVGSLGQAVHDASGASLGGAAYVFGGGAATTVATVQRWTSGSGQRVASLPGPRSDSAAAVVGGTAYVVGGFDGRGMARSVLATSDGRHFRVVARLAIGVRYPAVAAVGGAVYVIGGELATTEGTLAGGQTSAVQRIDPSSGTTRVVGHLSHPLGHATAFTIGGRLFVAGGRHGATAIRAVSEIDPRTGADHRVASLPTALSDAGVAVLASTAWLVGGETSGPAAPTATVTAVRIA